MKRLFNKPGLLLAAVPMLFSASTLANDASEIGLVAIEPNMQGLVEDLLKSQEIDLEILLSDSVPEQMIMQRSRVGITSKKWTDKEMARFDMRYGYRPTELMFTADVIAILANENNPATSITVAELIDVFGCSNDPKHPKWTPGSDIRGGESLDTHMLPFAIDHNLQGHTTFSSWVECGSDGEYANTQFLADLPDLINKIEDEDAAIGYTVYSDQISDVKWLSVVDNLGVNYDLNKETILSGRYPLATVYYMYLNIPAHRKGFTEQEKFFVGLTLSEEHQGVLNQYGFISLPPEAIQRNKVRLSLEEPAIEGGYK
ncbi:phosphate ABC transporter substrate-binding protein [Vibrio sp. Sgm 22]|uniref:PstS family phosphate ABC transporter substrate-binding protein n=1 Tax=unclassified Vibrio TaxID=2614977 RepID=UPI002248E67C|nr:MULTISPECIES: substrate-binding domain-containing protein [unclassified Vibrio]MCX2760930.1 phosphate ABC transporter substrate-binding protein [Vibrio sp. 14G-20]MCX2777906.1 phosphate ABC transporter substrate-binding protein [Vibrio sp. Sgm 22]